MEIKIDVDLGSVDAWRYIPQDMDPVLARAINDICREIQDVACSKDTHNFVSRTGKLESSIAMRDAKPDNLSGDVYIDDKATMITEGKWAGFSYGFFVHEGSKAHAIIPRNTKMLKFVTSENTAPPGPGHYGRFQMGDFTLAFAVWHPGARADPFIHKAAEKRQDFAQQAFEHAIESMLQRF